VTSTSSTESMIANLVEHASDGMISATEALKPDTDLQERGLTSLAFLQLVDAVENELGVYVDLEEDLRFMRTVAGISRYVEAQRA
jgi:acyl carrier protein